MDGDFDTGNVRYKSRERYSFGWSDPLVVSLAHLGLVKLSSLKTRFGGLSFIYTSNKTLS
jgi:hypothetical protein